MTGMGWRDANGLLLRNATYFLLIIHVESPMLKLGGANDPSGVNGA